MSPPAPVRIVLVDDHPIVRDGLRTLLEAMEGMTVVGEAASGEEAVEVVRSTPADVVIMDLEMPGIGGIEASRRIARMPDAPFVLILTMYADDAFVFAALRAGARGYLLKGAHSDEVARAIASAAAGDLVVAHGVAETLLSAFASTTGPAEPFPQLTEREREILDLLADGLSNGVIARRLGLTSKTVANHVSNVLTKLEVGDRAQAAVVARKAGLGH